MYLCPSVLISLTKTMTKNIHQQTFFLWLRPDVDKLKLISDDKNYDEMCATSSLTRRDGTQILFEVYPMDKIYPMDALIEHLRGSSRWEEHHSTNRFYFSE